MRQFGSRSPRHLAFLAVCFAMAPGWAHAAMTPSAPLLGAAEQALRLEIVSLREASAVAAADLLGAFLPSGSRVAADARTSQVILLTTEAGMARAERILAAIDVPAGARAAPAPQPTARRRMYDYELRGERYGAALARAEVARAPAPMPFQRTLGVLVARDDDSITIAHDGADAPARFVLPRLLAPDGAWHVRPGLTQSVAGIEVGSRVAVEWWEAEGVQYVEDAAELKRRPARTETSILGD